MARQHLPRQYPAAATRDALGDSTEHWDTARRTQAVAAATSISGALVFLLAVIVHPKRDGADIAKVGQLYGLTHGVQAIGLILQVIGLVSIFWPRINRLRPRDLVSLYAVLLGTIWYFGLIVVDGTRNPVTAKYAPSLVHTTADIDTATAIIVLPALLLFPVGYILLGLLHARYGARWIGLLIGAGAAIYITGGFTIFAAGPKSPAIQIIEIVGAVPYTLGVIMMARFWTRIPLRA